MGAFAGPGLGPGINRPVAVIVPSQPDPGTGLGPILFLDAKKRMFNLHGGFSIGHRIANEIGSHASLRKQGFTRTRLYSGLNKRQMGRIGSGLSLGHGRSRRVALSVLTIQKQTGNDASGKAPLAREAHQKGESQASISRGQPARNESAAKLSQEAKNSLEAGLVLRKQRRSRTEAHAEQEDDSELLAAADE